MKKFRRAAALALSAVLLASVFAGCGKTESPAASGGASSAASTAPASTVPDYMNPVGQFPITKEKITVKAMVAVNSEMAKDWNSLEVFQRLEKLTNIHWDFDYVDSANNNFLDQLSIRMAGDDYPEVMLMGNMSSDTEEAYGPTGKLLELTDLIDKYAPHLKEVRESNTTIKLANTALDGKIYGLPYYAESSANVPVLSFFDEQWMKNVGIEKVPETTDELYTLLEAFRDKDPNKNGKKDDIAFSCQGVGYLRTILQPAFQGYAGGSAADEWDVDDSGKAVYLPEEKGYKEYLEYCHKMYQDKLLDNEFLTQTGDQAKAKVQAGTVGFYNQTPTILAGTALEKDKQICLPPLTSPTNSKKVAQAPRYLYTTNGVITKNCKHPEAVMSWFDLFYRPEGEEVDGFCGKTSLLGYEGEQWKYTDSTKTKYEFIDPVKSYVQLNQSTMITFGLPAYLSNKAIQVGNQLMEDKLEGGQKNQAPYYREAYPLFVRFNKDESDQAALITTDLDNYQLMMEGKFINGQESLDNFDSFLQNLKKYRVDDLKKIKQEAYDRYAANK